MKYTEWLIKVKGIELTTYVNLSFDVRVELHREYEATSSDNQLIKGQIEVTENED